MSVAFDLSLAPVEAPLPTVCFAVSAHAEPSVMARVLEPFCKRGLLPRSWHATVEGSGAGALTIDIQVSLERELAALIAATLRQVVGVESVLTSEKRYAPAA